MIGPAEIEELLAEHASTRPASAAQVWPVMCPESERPIPKRRERNEGPGRGSSGHRSPRRV